MKGVPGLFIAIGLGVVGAFCNWLYLAQKGQELERVDFIAIADDVKINRGDRFVETHFAKLSVPGNNLGHLDKSAVLWSDMSTVVGQSATRSYDPGEVLLRQDLRTRAEADVKSLLLPDERVLWIPVDTRSFVASLVNSGDQVSFIVPRLTRGAPALADSPGDEPPAGPGAGGGTRPLGPFRILALGNRIGSQDVLRAAGITPSQENVMGVAVKIVDGQLDPLSQQLSDILAQTNLQQVQVLLHPPPEKGAR